MKIFAILLFSSISISVLSQDLPVFRQYLFNYYFLNPAYAGSEQCSNYCVSNRTQWVGVSDAPTTNIFSGTTQIAKKHGLGLAVWDDANGPNNYKGLRLSYSYHMILHKYQDKSVLKLALSLAYVGSVYSLDNYKFSKGIYDPIVKVGIDRSYHHDALVGAYLYGPNYFGGVSVANLFRTKASFYGDNEPLQPRYFYFSGGFRMVLAKDYDFEPSILFKTEDFQSKQIDFNTRFYYKFLNIAVSYRKSFYAPLSIHNSILGIIGAKILSRKGQTISLSYAYDLGLSDFSLSNQGSHELMLQFSICTDANSMRSVNCPAFH